MKVGVVLKRNREVLRTSNRPHRYIPFIVEDEDVKYQRRQIVKAHETFQNEINNNYLNGYLATVYGLLFKNEKKYHVKRNKLSLNNPKALIEVEKKRSNEESLPLTRNHQPIRVLKSFQGDSALMKMERKSIIKKVSLLNGSEVSGESKLYRLSPDHRRLINIIYSSEMYSDEYRKIVKEKVKRRFKGYEKSNSMTPAIPVNISCPIIKHKQSLLKDEGS